MSDTQVCNHGCGQYEHCFKCEQNKLRTEITEQKKTIKEQGESIGALMAKGISGCTARDKRIEELEGFVDYLKAFYGNIDKLYERYRETLASPTTGEKHSSSASELIDSEYSIEVIAELGCPNCSGHKFVVGKNLRVRCVGCDWESAPKATGEKEPVAEQRVCHNCGEISWHNRIQTLEDANAPGWLCNTCFNYIPDAPTGADDE